MKGLTLNWFDLDKKEGGDFALILPLKPYTEVIDSAFPELDHIGWRDNDNNTCYTYLKIVSDEEFEELRNFLELLKKIRLIPRSSHLEPYFNLELDQCYTLDTNYTEGHQERTKIGELEYQAKYNVNSKDKRRKCSDALAKKLAETCIEHVILNQVDYIVAIPANPSKAEEHLPDILVKKMMQMIEGPEILIVRKTRNTESFKNLSFENKKNQLHNVFACDSDLPDKKVLIIDDLYQSGLTMWSLAKTLKECGAKEVYGLACVKAWSDKDQKGALDSSDA